LPAGRFHAILSDGQEMQTSRLFGTSGIRGVFDRELSVELCRRVGRAIGTMLPPASTVCIATDSRTSREAVKGAVSSGLLESGTSVVDLGILPTPALALLTARGALPAAS
jgi:phosphomannomutase